MYNSYFNPSQKKRGVEDFYKITPPVEKNFSKPSENSQNTLSEFSRLFSGGLSGFIHNIELDDIILAVIFFAVLSENNNDNYPLLAALLYIFFA